MATVTSFGPSERVTIMVSGSRGGGARGAGVSTLTNLTLFVNELMKTHGHEEPEVEIDHELLETMKKNDPQGFVKYLSQLAANASQASAMSPEQKLVEAIKNLLKSMDIVLSKEDPGVDKYWVNPDDIQLQVVKIPGDGNHYYVNLAAPFGIS